MRTWHLFNREIAEKLQNATEKAEYKDCFDEKTSGVEKGDSKSLRQMREDYCENWEEKLQT